MTSERLKRIIDRASKEYFQLILLVGEAGSGKTKLLSEISKIYGISIVNLNLQLSSELMELSPLSRSVMVPKLLNGLIQYRQTTPIIFDNTELLFNPDLRQDPLRLLQGLSRNHTILASWNGSFKRNRLTYAMIGHPEYYYIDNPDAIVVEMAS